MYAQNKPLGYKKKHLEFLFIANPFLFSISDMFYNVYNITG